MRARGWIALVAVIALVIAGIATWWLRTYHRVERWVDLPRTGAAATDPLFALKLVLESQGRRVTTARRIDPRATTLAPDDTLLFDGDPRTLDAATRTALLDWLRRGGHLIVAVPPPDPVGDVFDPAHGSTLPVPLFDAVGVRVERVLRTRCVRSTDLPALPCNGRRFHAPAGAIVRIGDDEGEVVARVRVGAGRMDVLASLDFVTTDALERVGSRALAAQLFATDAPHGRVHLVHADALPSLWRTLVTRGWPVWAPLALLLAGALASRMRRFGPLLPSPVPERRSLLEHVAASGRLHWRFGEADRLHAALREAFLARLRRRDPETAALDGEPQLVRLVERLGLPAASIRDALTSPDPRDAKALVARIATLVRMGNRL
ncbi:DUF4350 domain-containing protein [Lysobacter xanthus]